MESPEAIPPEMEKFISLLKGMKAHASMLPGVYADEIEILLEFAPTLSHFIKGETRIHQLYLISALSGIANALADNIDQATLQENELKELKAFIAIATKTYEDMDKEALISQNHVSFRTRINTLISEHLDDPKVRICDFKPAVKTKWETLFSNSQTSFHQPNLKTKHHPS